MGMYSCYTISGTSKFLALRWTSIPIDNMLTSEKFNVVVPDTNDLVEPLAEWKTLDVFEARPAPLIIEIYLDLADLTPSQALVIMDNDDNPQRWDVAQALNPTSQYSARPTARGSKGGEVILERWRVELGESSSAVPSSDLILPNAYKMAVVLFRALFTMARVLPAWSYYKRIAKHPANQSGLQLKYRISNGNFQSKPYDTLEVPLIPQSGVVTSRYVFEPSMSPVGPFCISVTYRENCEFRVDDSESLLSSHFMASDDRYFQPSLSPRRASRSDPDHVPGSLPSRRRYLEEQQDPAQVYGSLSTFHGAVQPGTSPLSALRGAQWPGGGKSPTDSPPQKLPPNHRTAQGSRSSLRSMEPPAHPRRTSVSFQPFKAGSLASSPASGMMHAPVPPSPSTSSLGRDRASSQSPLVQGGTAGPVMGPPKRNSLNTLPQQAMRVPVPLPNETAIASSASSSPKPAPISRYSSSFSNRRNRFSSASAGTGPLATEANPRADDTETAGGNNSSGKGSVSSSTRVDTSTPDVAVTAASGTGVNSTASMQTDDDNLKDFLKLLEQKKELRSFNRSDEKAKEATLVRTTAALNKFQRMRDSNAALSDSLNSSMLLHRSSSSSSRQLSAVPPMVADRGTSYESTSPGKPISPHTPHTPAIPSRLSVGSVPPEDVIRSRARPGSQRRSSARQEAEDQPEREATEMDPDGIPIPTSPRAWPYTRRSSSVAHQHRQAVLDEPDLDLYSMRSTSLPNDGGDNSISGLLQLNEGQDALGPTAAAGALASAPTSATAGPDEDDEDDDSRPYTAGDAAADTHAMPFRTRASQRGKWRAPGSSTSSSTAQPSSAPGPNSARGSRYSLSSRAGAAARDEDDEPLLFTMSELEAQGRRSMEEGRGGSYLSSARRGGSSGATNGSSGRLGQDW